MKIIKFCSCLVFLSCLLSEPLSAISLGSEGKCYWEHGVQWQQFRYENRDNGFLADLPGEMVWGISDGNVYCFSKCGETCYEVHVSLNQRYRTPKKESEFINELKRIFGSEVLIRSIPSTQKKVKYIAQLYWNQESKAVRIYCTANQVYWAIVQGNDLDLAPIFFNAVKITK